MWMVRFGVIMGNREGVRDLVGIVFRFSLKSWCRFRFFLGR